MPIAFFTIYKTSDRILLYTFYKSNMFTFTILVKTFIQLKFKMSHVIIFFSTTKPARGTHVFGLKTFFVRLSPIFDLRIILRVLKGTQYFRKKHRYKVQWLLQVFKHNVMIEVTKHNICCVLNNSFHHYTDKSNLI